MIITTIIIDFGRLLATGALLLNGPHPQLLPFFKALPYFPVPPDTLPQPWIPTIPWEVLGSFSGELRVGSESWAPLL